MASGSGEKEDLSFPEKLYLMVEKESDEFIKWSEDGLWLMIHKKKFSEILTKYSMSSDFASFTRQLNLHGIHVNIDLQKEAVNKGQIKIDTSYKYFCHDFNLFREGHPELVQEIRKSNPGTKRCEKTNEDSDHFPKHRKLDPGKANAETADPRVFLGRPKTKKTNKRKQETNKRGTSFKEV